MSDNKKQPQTQTQSPEQLAKALGIQKPPEQKAPEAPKTETPKDEAKPETLLNRYLSGMSEASRKTVEALNKSCSDPSLIESIAADFFRRDNPNGMKGAFQTKVLEALKGIAAECLIDLAGQEVLARFPTTEGSVENTEVAPVGTYQAKSSGGKKGGGSGGQRSWGECTKTDEKGKVIAYESPSAMAKALGLRITGHSDQLHTFSHPKKAEGLDWEKHWTGKPITVTSGDLDHPESGIHVKLS